MLGFLQRTFCQLFCVRYKGNECFLAALYKEVGTLACDTLSTQNTSTLWRTTQLNAVDKESEAESDDDTSLYRLFGFSLYVGIKFRKKLFMVGFATITIQVEENGMHLN